MLSSFDDFDDKEPTKPGRDETLFDVVLIDVPPAKRMRVIDSMDVPDEHKDRIFDAEFKAEGIRIKASDDMPGQPSAVGKNFAIFVTFSDHNEQKQVFDKLAKDGQIQFPLENNFGMLVDKYNIQWMLAG